MKLRYRTLPQFILRSKFRTVTYYLLMIQPAGVALASFYVVDNSGSVFEYSQVVHFDE